MIVSIYSLEMILVFANEYRDNLIVSHFLVVGYKMSDVDDVPFMHYDRLVENMNGYLSDVSKYCRSLNWIDGLRFPLIASYAQW